MLSLLLGAAGLGLGYLLIDLFLKGSSLDALDRWALAFVGLTSWVLVLTIVHIVTAGQVFSHPWLVRLSTAGLAIVMLVVKVRKRAAERGTGLPVRTGWIAIGSVLLVVTTWGAPILRRSWLVVSPDIHLHMGWAEQLLNGLSLPSATITGDVPNYYPWLYHAFAAFLKSFVPGNSAFLTLGPLQVLVTAAMGLALFALGRALAGGLVGAVTTVFFGGVLGHITIPLLGAVFSIANLSSEQVGDLAAPFEHLSYHRSFNLPWHNLAPPYPRDIGLALFAILLVLLFRAVETRSSRLLLLSGVTLGLSGLVGGEGFLVGVVASALILLRAPRWDLRTILSRFVAPTLVLYALWLVPMAVNYVRLGGFVNITRFGPVDLSALDFAAQWGLILVPALVGLVLVLRRARADRTAGYPVIVVVAASACLFAASFLPIVLGSGFVSISRSHRYWPYLYLAAASLAGIALEHFWARIKSRRPVVVGATSLTILALAIGVTASRAVIEESQLSPGYAALQNGLNGRPDSLLAALSEFEGDCHVAAPAPFGREISSFTGHRLVSWVGRTKGYNSARIRWNDIYDRIPDGLQRRANNKALIKGLVDTRRWDKLVKRYGVDVLVTQRSFAREKPLSRFEPEPVTWDGDDELVMLTLSRCEAG